MLMNYFESKHGTHFTLALLVCDVQLAPIPVAAKAAQDAVTIDDLRATMGIPSCREAYCKSCDSMSPLTNWCQSCSLPL